MPSLWPGRIQHRVKLGEDVIRRGFFLMAGKTRSLRKGLGLRDGFASPFRKTEVGPPSRKAFAVLHRSFESNVFARKRTLQTGLILCSSPSHFEDHHRALGKLSRAREFSIGKRIDVDVFDVLALALAVGGRVRQITQTGRAADKDPLPIAFRPQHYVLTLKNSSRS